jgi:hypothetical protein
LFSGSIFFFAIMLLSCGDILAKEAGSLQPAPNPCSLVVKGLQIESEGEIAYANLHARQNKLSR